MYLSDQRRSFSVLHSKGQNVTTMTANAAAIRAEALTRATCGKSTANFTKIIEGFMARGIPCDEITPRENVFTYNAWLALGRQVRKGEHGVKVLTFAPGRGEKSTDAKTGEVQVSRGRRPWMATVFHVSQTDPVVPE